MVFVLTKPFFYSCLFSPYLSFGLLFLAFQLVLIQKPRVLLPHSPLTRASFNKRHKTSIQLWEHLVLFLHFTSQLNSLYFFFRFWHFYYEFNLISKSKPNTFSTFISYIYIYILKPLGEMSRLSLSSLKVTEIEIYIFQNIL